MDNYKSNADRQVMGLKTEGKPQMKEVESILRDQEDYRNINNNIIPFPLDRLPKQLSDLYIYIIDLKKELKSAVMNNPEARKKIKVLNSIDNDLNDISKIIINNIVKKLDEL